MSLLFFRRLWGILTRQPSRRRCWSLHWTTCKQKMRYVATVLASRGILWGKQRCLKSNWNDPLEGLCLCLTVQFEFISYYLRRPNNSNHEALCVSGKEKLPLTEGDSWTVDEKSCHHTLPSSKISQSQNTNSIAKFQPVEGGSYSYLSHNLCNWNTLCSRFGPESIKNTTKYLYTLVFI